MMEIKFKNAHAITIEGLLGYSWTVRDNQDGSIEITLHKWEETSKRLPVIALVSLEDKYSLISRGCD